MKIINLTICGAIIVLTSCVPQRLLEETKTKLTNCETESAAAKKLASETEAKNTEMREKITKEEKELAGLQRDTAIMSTNLRLLSNKYDKLNLVNDQLLDKYNRMLLGSEKDNASLSGKLQLTQEQLLKKENIDLNKLIWCLYYRYTKLNLLTGLQGAVLPKYYDILAKEYHATIECFGSFINHHYKYYFGLFYDLEKYEKSIFQKFFNQFGSFFQHNC